ncbi:MULTISPECIES: hypothetical protein [Enterobacterales]|uniref:Rhs-family protein n=1 Tax=Candidatus Sodalis endolongispinus TaxID=2812662 RepID=A0ABS5YC61_9GAMM|nr:MULTISPECIES: hypothetical protein [Enterobacterales]MBG6247513.1 hypothetical protein [Candidatus Symbiopectobacterium sp. PLON1]MBT9432608.1 hypothetical protein [Candidatus Sodalis endolongispinus]
MRHLDETTTLTTTRVWRHADYALLSYIDAYGNITRYHYAPEGYLEKTQYHADTPDATISHRRLEDDFCQNRLITLTLTDIQGNRIISQVDGFGRLHRRDYQCQQHPLFSLPIEQRKYDSLGRLSRLITHDHADEEGAFRPLATRYHDVAWDQWGRHYASVDHDGEQGVCHYHHLDIIKQKSRRQSRSYRHRSQRANTVPHYSGILYERYRCGKPRRQLRLLPQPEDDKALIISELRLEYDHQYRLNAVQERQIGQAIRWRYNEDDRVEQQTLQDGSLLHYGYPSPGDGPTSIDFSAASTAPLQKLYRYDTDHWGRRTAVREGGSPAAVSIGYPSLSPLPNHYQDADGDITQFFSSHPPQLDPAKLGRWLSRMSVR